jgi:hypothetical protein
MTDPQAALPGIQFRWQYWDDALGLEWSEWHTVGGSCPKCCCGGPEAGEHREPSEYEEDGILERGHARLDPRDVDEHQTVEWRTPA